MAALLVAGLSPALADNDDSAGGIMIPSVIAPSSTGVIPVIFVLKRQRDDLAQLALAVSDPSSTRYGLYPSVAQIAIAYGASLSTIFAVDDFLSTYGASATADFTRTVAYALLTEDQVHAIFGPSPTIYPPVPTGLAPYVTGVVGAFDLESVESFERIGPTRGAAERPSQLPPWPAWAMGSGTPAACPASDPEQCSDVFANPGPPEAFRSFTPDQLRTAYGFERANLRGSGRSAVVVELGQAVDPADVAAYTAGLGLPPAPLVQASLVPGVYNSGSEATLDVETILGLTPDLDRLTLVVSPAETNGETLTFWPLLFSAALDPNYVGSALPDVISSSWFLACEPELFRGPVFEATETIFETAAAAGVTVVFSSGDQGSSACTSRQVPYDDRARAVEYPGSSPWVTSVGGTNLVLNADNSIQDAQVWNDWPLQLDRPLSNCATPPCRPNPVWAGTGGESILFPRPSWQKGVGVDLGGMRQVPDVSFLGDIYPATLLHYRGVWSGQGNGTSQAAPIFAALTLALNEAGAENRRPRIGFANPLLYLLAAAEPTTFFDVVEGDNVIGDNAAQFPVDCCAATPGYDKASGLGSLLLDRAVPALKRRLASLTGPRLPRLHNR
jgi:kumamolisin